MKKASIRIVSLFLSLLFAITIVTNPAEMVEAASVKISNKSIVLIVGQAKTLKVKGTKKKVKWTTSKKSVAKVSSKGKITAKKTGKATITAKVGGKKYKCKVTVYKPKISKTKATLIKGNSFKLQIKNAGTLKVKWKSSDKKIATVSSKGKVTAKKKGTATITATVNQKKYKCKITVTSAKKQSNTSTSNPTIPDVPPLEHQDTLNLTAGDFPLHLYSNDGREYLGKLVTNKYDADSIWNKYGIYGSEFSSNSIWNEFGTYGSKFNSYSAFNDFASHPPVIITNNGYIVGYLTSNEYKPDGYTIFELQRILINYGQ